MRLVPPERIYALLPAELKRVGLVGAAVTDHPRLPAILHHIVVERGLEVGISSLRADRLTSELVGLLKGGGYRTLTVASDGASERMRELVERRTREKHLLRAAELAREHGLRTLKVYMMVGLPTRPTPTSMSWCGFRPSCRSWCVRRLASRRLSPSATRRSTGRLCGHRRSREPSRPTAPRAAWDRGSATDLRSLGLGRVRARAGR